MDSLESNIYWKRLFGDAFWVTNDFEKVYKEDVDDELLTHIVVEVSSGGGKPFFTVPSKINVIFQEAYDRKILPQEVLLIRHQWALYFNNDEKVKNMPNFYIDLDGNIKKMSEQLSK